VAEKEDTRKLRGKVAIVTGGSSGIGAGIARALGAQGAVVIVNYTASKDGADAVVAAIADAGGTASAVQADMSQEADVVRLFEAVIAEYGKLDVLINNAGVAQFEMAESLTEEAFHRQFNVNVLGYFLAIREAVRHFGDGGGSIVNISSILSTHPSPGTSIYAATKGAVDTMTYALARELGPRGIRVNAVAPGPVWTPLNPADKQAPDVAEFGRNSDMGRAAQPEELSPAYVFLASPVTASYISGVVLPVMGGPHG